LVTYCNIFEKLHGGKPGHGFDPEEHRQVGEEMRKIAALECPEEHTEEIAALASGPEVTVKDLEAMEGRITDHIGAMMAKMEARILARIE
jgi:hypothetical protein